MLIENIFDINADQRSIFLDNLALCSADRLITGNYSAIQNDPIFTDGHGGGRDAAAVLISHDLVNLAIILESLVCFDRIYVNADYIDRWNPGIEGGTLATIDNLVSGIRVPRELQWAAENAAIRNIEWKEFDRLTGVEELSRLVHITTHNNWDRYGDTRTMKARILSPYQEATRVLTSDYGIMVGAAFYMGCSQALGVPYRPSALRARLMNQIVSTELIRWRFDAGTVAFRLLEESRGKALHEFFGDITDFNIVEFSMPPILGAVLVGAKSPAEIIPLTLQIRNLPEAREFRDWCTNFTATIHHGHTEQIAKEYGQLKRVLERVNRQLGVSAPKEFGLSLGWGPVQVSRSFSFPRKMTFPTSLKRHALFMQNIYHTILQAARFSDQVERVLYPGLPYWMSELIQQRPIAWMQENTNP